MARFKYERNLQSLARCVGSTCHDGLLVPGVWDLPWRAPHGVGHPETHPRTRGAVGYAEYSSRTLAPGLQLCKECNCPTLRSTAERWVEVPVFAVSCLQGSFDQPQEAVVVDIFLQDVHQDVGVDILEATLDVSFNEPFGPVPCMMDFCQGRLASPVRSEPVTVLGKLWFIVCLKDGSYYILNHLWRPVWHAEWSFSTLRLVYIDAPCWRPLPPFVAQCFDHSVNLIE